MLLLLTPSFTAQWLRLPHLYLEKNASSNSLTRICLSAGTAGSVLYGGAIDNCDLDPHD